jgi:hypothetical protein
MMEELLEVFKCLNKKKMPGTDSLIIELLKCAFQKLTDMLIGLIKIWWSYRMYKIN